MRLINGFCELDKFTHGLGLRQALLQVFELRLDLVLATRLLERCDVLAPRDGKDVQFVVKHQAVFAGTKRKNKALIEPSDD